LTLPRILIAVVGCRARLNQIQAQRSSWGKDCRDFDLKFFTGKSDGLLPLPDEVFLDVDDSYTGLAAKVQAVCRWASCKYDWVLKTDDDSIVFPKRIKLPHGSYAGWVQEPATDNWCSGLSYWLAKQTMEAVASAELTKQSSEDRWVGSVMKSKGVPALSYPGITWIGRREPGEPLPRDLKEKLARATVAGEFAAHEMAKVYSLCQ
jgi:hypothetical protein